MIRIGIICPSEIAFRRFLPSLQKAGDSFEFAGVAIASPQEWFGDLSQVKASDIQAQQERERGKAQTFVDQYGGKIYEGYQNIIESSDVDAMYIPLPPALHFQWAKLALEKGKHVFVEKPSTIDVENTEELVDIAKEKNLAIVENYGFVHHPQIALIKRLISDGEIVFFS